MRLIDADELKKAFESWKAMDDYYHDTDCDDIPLSEANDLIDNAPTVENDYNTGYQDGLEDGLNDIRPTGEWIPVTTRDMTREDAKELLVDLSDLEDFYDNPESYWLYNCPLPDDGQEVLVSTKWGIRLTTFYSDVDYGNYFEEYEDRYDVDAWMPLPEPYEKEVKE